MVRLNMVSRDEFDTSQYDLELFEAHFEVASTSPPLGKSLIFTSLNK